MFLCHRMQDFITNVLGWEHALHSLTWAGVIVEMPLLVQDAIKWEDKCDASLRSLFVSVFFCLCLLINLLITSY